MRAAVIVMTLSLLPAGCATRLSEAQMDKLAAAANQARKTGVCNIHHVRMQKELVRVEYAHLPAEEFSSAYEYARMHHFPHAREYALSLNTADDGKKTRVFVCPEYKKALREWLAKHPNDEWGKIMAFPKKV